MKFFTALIGTCKNTKIFISLMSQSLGRAFLHLFLLVLICSLFITLCTYSSRSEEIDEVFTQLKETFGEIQLGKQGIISEKIKETKSVLIADDLYRLTYLPKLDKAKLPKIDADDINSGFLWTPTILAAWFKIGPDKFILFPFAYLSDRQLSIKSINSSSILPYIKKNTSLKNDFISISSEISWASLKDYTKTTFTSMTLFGNIIGIILQTLVFVAMFSFILNLSSKTTGAPALKYKTRFVIGLYTSFPPLLIATMFRAFELPFVSFNSVYVICFSVYLIVVFTQLQLNLNASGQDKTEEQES